MISFIVKLRSRAHFTIRAKANRGVLLSRPDPRRRIALLIVGFILLYTGVGARLVQYGLTDTLTAGGLNFNQPTGASRPHILHRHRQLLATGINTLSPSAETRTGIDADEGVGK